MEEEEKTFVCHLECSNCRDDDLYQLPKGTRIRQVECDNCGVQALRAWTPVKEWKGPHDDESDL